MATLEAFLADYLEHAMQIVRPIENIHGRVYRYVMTNVKIIRDIMKMIQIESRGRVL